MLLPRKQKYRKLQRNRGQFKGKANKGNLLAFGKFGIKSTEMAEITSRQIEAARRVISRATKRGGKTWIRIFPHKPITQKSAETPMGSGKGTVEYYVSLVKPGTVIFEMDGVTEEIAKKALKLAAYKLPVGCRFITAHKD
ncbi:50S ribosomal protein L16 [Patescibacteria group bacterium]|nr:50S ribosomal protein L16 [Patescibacteria group bacterium]